MRYNRRQCDLILFLLIFAVCKTHATQKQEELNPLLSKIMHLAQKTEEHSPLQVYFASEKEHVSDVKSSIYTLYRVANPHYIERRISFAASLPPREQDNCKEEIAKHVPKLKSLHRLLSDLEELGKKDPKSLSIIPALLGFIVDKPEDIQRIIERAEGFLDAQNSENSDSKCRFCHCCSLS